MEKNGLCDGKTSGTGHADSQKPLDDAPKAKFNQK